MSEQLEKMIPIIEEKVPTIVEAIKNAEPTSKEYQELLNNFNSSVIIYSQIQEMFAQRQMMKAAAAQAEAAKENTENKEEK